MEKKRYFINLFLLISIVLIIASFIFVVDPAKVFSNEYSNVAKIVLNNNIQLKTNLDERVLKKEVIKNLKIKNDLLILGSSRVMLLGNKEFVDKKVFNAGVSGAGLEDQLALLNIYLENKGYPKEILFGIDPWTFNINSDNRWKIIKDEYVKYQKQVLKTEIESPINKPKLDISKYLKLLEFMYFKDSIKHVLKNGLNLNKRFYNIISDEGVYESKGNVYLKENMKLVYSKGYRTKNDGSNWRANFGYQLKNSKELDKNLKKEFVSTLIFLKSKDVNIKIFLPPYNPALIEAQEKENPKYNKMLQNTEAFILDEAEKLGIEVIGSYFSENMKINDFYDGIHLREEKLSEIFSKNIK